MRPIKILPVFFMLLIFSSPLLASQVQNFSFTDINGKAVSWSDMKGKPAVVNIGSHW